MNYLEYAREEFQRANVSKDCATQVEKLLEVWSKQQHSGLSASITNSVIQSAFEKAKEQNENIISVIFNYIKEKGWEDSNDEYVQDIVKAVKEIADELKSLDYSKCPMNKILEIFLKVSMFQPLTTLTFDKDEWVYIGNDCYQNKRNFAVFKDGEDGRPYYINAYYIRNQDGVSYRGSLALSNGKVIRRCYIKNPANMPQIQVNVNEKKEGNRESFIYEIVNEKEVLKELEKYYDIEYFIIDKDKEPELVEIIGNEQLNKTIMIWPYQFAPERYKKLFDPDDIDWIVFIPNDILKSGQYPSVLENLGVCCNMKKKVMEGMLIASYHS